MVLGQCCCPMKCMRRKRPLVICVQMIYCRVYQVSAVSCSRIVNRVLNSQSISGLQEKKDGSPLSVQMSTQSTPDMAGFARALRDEFCETPISETGWSQIPRSIRLPTKNHPTFTRHAYLPGTLGFKPRCVQKGVHQFSGRVKQLVRRVVVHINSCECVREPLACLNLDLALMVQNPSVASQTQT